MATQSNRPTHNVFTVTKKDGEEKGDWFEIGAAWPHQDGKGFNIVFKALPMPGADVVMRVRKEKDSSGK
jgi:hypothetical protein